MFGRYDNWTDVRLALLVAIFVGVAAPAVAAPETITVQVNRSELQSPEGAATLYREIEYAAWLSCETPPQPHDEFLNSTADRTCQKITVAKTVTEINDPRLSEFHRQRVEGAVSGRKSDHADR